MNQNTLKEKTIQGASWSFVDSILTQGISFVVGIVLARLRTPEEYGVIGIVTIFIVFFNCIVDSGFSNALIRKNNADDNDYNTVFYSNLLLSIILFIILYISAPLISNFFSQPILIPVTRVMGIIVLLNAFGIIQRTILVKNVDFKTQTKVSIIASLTSGVIGIGLALVGYGVWSLVWQQITRQFLNTLFLWIFNKWRPKKQFSSKSFKELFSFGWKLLVSGLIDKLWGEIYQIVIGKCYSAASLGQYSRANQFATLFSGNLTTVIQRVSYPVLSSIQDEQERLKESYRKLIKVTMYVTLVFMLGLAAAAKSIVLVLIGNQWYESISYLQIICFYMMLYPLHAINLNMLQVKGRSDLFLYLEIIKKSIAVIPIILGIFINIYWMLWGSVITGLIAYFLNSYYSGKELKYNCWRQIVDIFPSFLIASIMSIVVYILSFINISPFLLLPLQIVVGAGIIISLSISFKLPEYIEIKGMANEIINKLKHGK